MARDNSSTEDETGPKQAVDDLAVGDKVTVCISGRLTEIYEDRSGKLDASGMEIPFWPDELCGVETGTESETEAGIEADDDSENADPRLIISEETEGTQETDNSETATGPEAGSVAPDPIDMATEIVEVLEDGNRRRAQLLADRLSETLIEE
jgi:hypothetical protein